MHARHAVFIAAAVAVIAAGCGGAGGRASQSGGQPTLTTASATPRADPTPATTNSPGDLALGESAVTPRGSRMTVHSWGSSERTSAAPSGSEWQAGDVEFCLSPSVRSTVPINVITNEFRLETADGSQLEPDTEAALASEAFADPDGTIADEACVRGPVVFAVPVGKDPAYFLLASPLGTLRWRLH